MNRPRWLFLVLGVASIATLLGFQVFRNLALAQSRQWTPFQADMVEQHYQAGTQDPFFVQKYVYARRGDGSWVESASMETAKDVWVTQRMIHDYSASAHISIDPGTQSRTTYRYSAKEVDYLSTVPATCNSDSSAAHVEMLGYDTVEVKFSRLDRFNVTEWRAPRLNCFALKVEMDRGSLTVIHQALDVEEGAPANSLFAIPSTYVERAPSEVMAEHARRFPSDQNASALATASNFKSFDEAYKNGPR